MGLIEHVIDGWEISKAFNELSRDRQQLTERFSLPEVNARPPRADEDISVWRFDNVLMDKLKEKGWPIDSKNDPFGFELRFLVGLLEHRDFDRGTFRTSELLRRYPSSSGNSVKKEAAVEFLRSHISDLQQVANDLRSFTEADLQDNHRDVLIGNNRLRSYGPILPEGGYL